MRVEFGYCVCCEKEIAPKCPTCNVRRPGGQYTEVQMNLSDGTRTHQPVCLECSKGKIWEMDKMELSRHWHEAFRKQGKPHHNQAVHFV